VTASRLADIPGCAYATLEDLRQACSEGRAFLSVDQSFSIKWIHLPGVHPSRAETVFHFTLSWTMGWVGLLMAALAWRFVGPKALVVLPVSLMAGLYCRPWRGHLTWLVALAVLIFGHGLLRWAGGTWLLTAFLVSSWVSWCADRLSERLLHNEALLTWALQPRGPDPILQRPVAAIRPGSKRAAARG